MHVLEIAAGAGLGSLDIAKYLVDGSSKLPPTTKRVFTVTDLSPVMVNMAKENFNSVNDSSVDIQFTEANGQDMAQIASASVDRYVASLCLQLAPDPDAMLNEAMRVLTTNGIAGFTIWGSPDRSGTFAINAAANKELGLEENTTEHSNFIMGRNLPALRRKFAQAGFNHVQIWPFQCIVELWSGEEFAKLHRDMFPLERGQENLQERRFDIVKRMADEYLAEGTPIGLETYIIVARASVDKAKAMLYKSPVTSHILDTSLGRPAADVRVDLQQFVNGKWIRVNEGRTNADGRVSSHLVPESSSFEAGTYRMVFYTQAYFEANGVSEFFYPEVTIAFVVKDPTQHYHVPLLINPFGYSTYRGS
ncbi:5-hydroxyisourate hydrolase [Phytophthora citrophthora]|uniref:hydroxyisourate hydrolase n=1 Tax=Phytophthora citrophthora TaxID=4793 RepID=A0AAD9LE95_9STRA|nr:5-hydroxyisourate hydrolase [Phytophthora citrophthora]